MNIELTRPLVRTIALDDGRHDEHPENRGGRQQKERPRTEVRQQLKLDDVPERLHLRNGATSKSRPSPTLARKKSLSEEPISPIFPSATDFP